MDEAKSIVYNYALEHLDKTDANNFLPDDVYIVWWCFTLGNWKALLSTNLPDGMYYEVTHNAAKDETYLDVYKKLHNVVC